MSTKSGAVTASAEMPWPVRAVSIVARSPVRSADIVVSVMVSPLGKIGKMPRLPRALGDTVTRCLSRGALEEGRSACERSPSPIADVFLVGYERLNRSKPEHVVTAVHRERLRVNQDLRARMWILGTVGAPATYDGLFGTVVD